MATASIPTPKKPEPAKLPADNRAAPYKLVVPGLEKATFLVVALARDAGQKSLRSEKGVAFVLDGHDGTRCRLVTAAHVVAGSTEVFIQPWRSQFRTEKPMPARVLWTEPTVDLAMLAVDLPADRCRTLPRASAAPVPLGSTVFAIWHAPNQASLITHGILSGVWDLPDLGEIIVADIPVLEGHSGSPLVDAKGRLLGMVQNRTTSHGLAVAYVLPVGRLEAAITREAKDDGGQAQPSLPPARISSESGLR